ncbi:MarR family transcriptional regulator [Arthrobacter sp. JZ12]|uniref:MarR family transcriptional regulator n=1 Tax=Arthrobacter sp. JZ12 TaxID=2654190 RepID=UPI002B45FDE0|nr:MarR family transcriptional regulator [Arthrobacter sp. JZ12]WRH24593.1 MarR family transcriptional regulator [Arthrobacter sp. JZ12]
MFVLTIDQRDSQHGADRIPHLLRSLSDLAAAVPFERSVGDEAQGILQSADDVVEATLRCIRDGGWYVGIGIGTVEEPLPVTPREGRGSAFVAARAAVERAKKSADRAPLAVEGPKGAAEAEGVLALIARFVMHRSDAEWRILDLLEPQRRGSQSAVARALDISPQAVSKAVFRSAWVEEWSARPAAAVLLQLADRNVNGGKS